ncbi:MAG: methyltransferase [Candidatus Diapherotrites archaeon]|nr:methyltransferase [Candidatus Diapherotrites archaeon]
MKYYFFKDKQLPLLDSLYEPREDSYLLAKTVKIQKGETTLDMGCGSGIQTINVLLQGAQATAADVNEVALKNTELCAYALGFKKNLKLIHSNLFEKISITEKFDTIVFNPPYVESHSLAIPEIDGGKKGRQILDKFLKQVPNYLNPKGSCYFLQSNLNGVKETEKKLAQLNFSFQIIAKEKIWFEELQVWKISANK